MKPLFGKTRPTLPFLYSSWMCGLLVSRFFAPLPCAEAAPALSPVESVAALCEDGQCQPVITQVQFFGRTAYRLTDGKTEAIIVPQIGRIMKFGRVGGPNLLWNASTPEGINWGWRNYGGDKNWLAPQDSWALWQGKAWPPDSAFDGHPYEVEVMTGGKLRITSPLSDATGIRMSRTFFFNGLGEFVIEQTAKKERGEPIRASIWNIAQTVPGQAVFLPVNPQSAYQGQHQLLQGDETFQQPIELVTPRMLRIRPQAVGKSGKLGVDAPVSALVSVRDGVAFLQKTAHPEGVYPDGKTRDGKEGAGFPVELFINTSPKLFYYEMELLSPLREFHIGSAWTHTMRWSLHNLPSKDVTSPEVSAMVEKLLRAPFAQ